jgi:ABC-2 type transport system ATP-binding protein
MAGTAPAAQPAGGEAPVLRASGFAKRYGAQVAVQGLDLTVQRGEIFGLIGPDGAGKSSLMKAAAGVLNFEGGSLAVFGTALTSEREAERIKGRIGLMPQGLGQNLYGDLSVEENVDFFARLRLVPPAELARRKQELLSVTRLDKFRDRPMKQLSGGMKQKLGLVCTLIHEPEFVILDEPTTGVDPVSRRDFWNILADLLRTRGTTALVSTAYMDEASRFNRVALMFGGRLLACGTPQAIRELAAGTTVAVTGGDQVRCLDALGRRFTQVEALGPAVRVFVDDLDEPAAVQAVRATLPPAQDKAPAPHIEAFEPELEDVFIALLRRRELVSMKPATLAQGTRQSVRSGTLAIEADALVRQFGAFRAVDQVSFQVPQGEIFGLLGANGAGKSTVIKMLTGILQPTAGRGQVAGADMRRAGFAIKERIGYMSQAFSLYMDLTVLENIHLYAGIYGLDAARTRERTAWVLDMADLAGSQRARAASLPMGLRQRLALGCALVHQPQVVFLDEPTSGVDPVGRRAFWDILFRLSREQGMTVLVTTHYMSEAEHCDHLALMYAGRVVADDSPAGMKAAVEREAGRLLEISTGTPRETARQLEALGFGHVTLFGRKVHALAPATLADPAAVAPWLATQGLAVGRVQPRDLTMEDVFVYRVTEIESREAAAAARAGTPSRETSP